MVYMLLLKTNSPMIKKKGMGFLPFQNVPVALCNKTTLTISQSESSIQQSYSLHPNLWNNTKTIEKHIFLMHFLCCMLKHTFPPVYKLNSWIKVSYQTILLMNESKRLCKFKSHLHIEYWQTKNVLLHAKTVLLSLVWAYYRSFGGRGFEFRLIRKSSKWSLSYIN